MTRFEDHPGVLAMLQALASDPHAISPSAAAGFAERAIGLIEALLAENARVRASYDALHDAQCRLEEKARNLNSALAKAHEAAEISECRIAEVYGLIVQARDIVRPWLEPGLDDFRDLFQLLQNAKYGLGGRTNVAGTIAALTRGETP